MLKEIVEGLDVLCLLSVIVMIIVVVAMGVDFVSGWRKAKIRGEERTSYAASRTLTKFLIYEGILIIGCCMDIIVHFAWLMFVESIYYVPLITIIFGFILCLVEAWSVQEKAEEKQRKRMDEAAAALAKILDKDTVLELLRARAEDAKKIVEEQ